MPSNPRERETTFRLNSKRASAYIISPSSCVHVRIYAGPQPRAANRSPYSSAAQRVCVCVLWYLFFDGGLRRSFTFVGAVGPEGARAAAAWAMRERGHNRKNRKSREFRTWGNLKPVGCRGCTTASTAALYCIYSPVSTHTHTHVYTFLRYTARRRRRRRRERECVSLLESTARAGGSCLLARVLSQPLILSSLYTLWQTLLACANRKFISQIIIFKPLQPPHTRLGNAPHGLVVSPLALSLSLVTLRVSFLSLSLSAVCFAPFNLSSIPRALRREIFTRFSHPLATTKNVASIYPPSHYWQIHERLYIYDSPKILKSDGIKRRCVTQRRRGTFKFNLLLRDE